MWFFLAILIAYSSALTFPTKQNFDISTALKINSPNTHQTYLTSIEHEPRYFEFDIKSENKLEISLFTTSSSKDNGLSVGLALLCSNSEFSIITTSVHSTTSFSSQLFNDTLFNNTEGYSDMVFQVNSPSAVSVQYTNDYYPATKRVLADLTITDPPAGHYYLVIFPYSDNKKSHIGFTMGSEDLQFDDLPSFLLTPFDVVMYFNWQRKSIISITVPLAAPVLIGLIFYILIAIIKKLVNTIHEWIMALASLAFLSTAILWLTQLIYCVIQSTQNNTSSGYTAIVIALSLIYTAIAAIEALRKKEDYPDLYWNRTNRYLTRFLLRRIAMIVWSGLALFTWSGYIVGPGLVFIAAVMPPTISFYPQSKILNADTELNEMDVQRARLSV